MSEKETPRERAQRRREAIIAAFKSMARKHGPADNWADASSMRDRLDRWGWRAPEGRSLSIESVARDMDRLVAEGRLIKAPRAFGAASGWRLKEESEG